MRIREAAKKFAGVGALGSLALFFATSTLFAGATAPEAKADGCFGGGYPGYFSGGYGPPCGQFDGGYPGGGFFNPPGPAGGFGFGGGFAAGGCGCGAGFGPGPVPGPFYNVGGFPGPA